ncbi:MAG: class I SAM-dependent methyltransferase [Phycisphaerae bacterium]|nr:class I SAM-dependent methyltransferase [Gemmatimonadaceae bacterium]
MSGTLIDFAPIKARQHSAWSTGNYAVVGTTLQIVGEQLCEAVDLRAGARVLDVAAGNGNATLAAARRFAEVTSTDYVGSLLDAGRKRADAEGLHVNFREADAEDLPFAAASFDVVLSTFGVMFTPDQDRAAAELVRVCKPRGKIGLANWTPHSFVGEMFKVIGKYIPPAAGVEPPSLWGTESRLFELFRNAASIDITKRFFNFRYRNPQHLLEVFRTYYGPMHKAFAALDAQPAQQVALTQDLLDLIRKTNRATEPGIVLPSEYLEVVVTTGDMVV